MDYAGTGRSSLGEIYEKMSGVSIDEQMKLWDARGKGYYGEYLLFSEIYTKVPGCCKILMNLEIPSEHGKTTEIDLLLIHETGLYVFEAKHYKGTIYGKMDDRYWTQYFRTASNNRFNNPIKQNRWHVEQLHRLHSNLPIHSFVVFTSSECELKVSGCLENATLCNQYNMISALERVCRDNVACMTPDEMDVVFNSLKAYSPIHEAVVKNDEEILGFYEFLDKIKTVHAEKLRNLDKASIDKDREYIAKGIVLQQNYFEKEKAVYRKLQITKWISIVACIAFAFVCVIISSILIASSALSADDAKRELQEFREKWQQITDFEVDKTMIKKDFILVDNVFLKNVTDINNVVRLSGLLTYNGEDYYVVIDKNSLFTVVLADGRVLEYPYYSSSFYSYSLGYPSACNTLEIKDRELSGFRMEEVAFIKLTKLRIERINRAYGEKSLLTDYEIVLYTAE